MSEVFITFMGLCLITTVQYFIVINHLDRLEQKINALEEKDND